MFLTCRDGYWSGTFETHDNAHETAMTTADRRRKVLICGGTGFIGRNLVDRFRRRGDVEVEAVCFTRPPVSLQGVTWRQADLCDVAAVHDLLDGVDTVIQAAAATSGVRDTFERPHIHVTDNAVMNSLLLRAAFERRVRRFIFFSCSNMLSDDAAPQDENAWNPAASMNPRYFGIGWTKAYIEKMCEFFAGRGVTRHTVIRHSNIYGPHDKFDLERSHMFGAAVTKAMTARDGFVTLWGDGREQRDLLYVDDLVDLVEAVADRQEKPFDLLNAGAGVGVPVAEVMRRIIHASGRTLEIQYDPSKPSIKSNVVLDCGYARRLYGWTPKVSLDDGAARTVAWWRDNIAAATD